ncbi:MAG: DUF423 domain-containing protein [Pseudomonadota bacterium]
MLTKRLTIAIAALAGMLAVLAGAFGAHGFERSGDMAAAALFDTASTYQMWHALALLALAALGLHASPAAPIFVAAILLFSGSLYAYALTDIGWLVWLTPIGGLAFIIGWALFALSAWRTL